jgi:hypothetical protein
MPRTLTGQNSKIPKPSFPELWQLIENFVEYIPPLQSRGKRPLQMTFEHQLKSLILFHVEEYDSARHLLQVLEQDDFARSYIAPPEGISRSSYGEALNTRGIPGKVYLTDGKGDEGPLVPQLLSPGQTGIMDRNYQCYRNFDLWQEQNLKFVCRIKASTIKTCLETYPIPEGGPVFHDALMRLGAPRANQTQLPVRVVGYWVDDKKYWVATNRFDLSASDIALIYKLRWEIEKFFGWWKQHLNVYPLIARSAYGFMVQVLGGLITYLLLAIFCHKYFQERVSIKRVRELRINMQKDPRMRDYFPPELWHQKNYAYAKT